MLEKLRLVLKFKVMTRLLLVRKKIYAIIGGRESNRMMVNIGGGLFFRPHWKVLDYISPFYAFSRQYIDYNCDLMATERFPFDDNSVDFFYSSHTLEHIPEECCAHVMQEIFRCLKPGGSVRISVPDYELVYGAAKAGDQRLFPQKYGAGLSHAEVVIDQIATELVGRIDKDELQSRFEKMSPAAFADHCCGIASREVQKEYGGYHINWFDGPKLLGALSKAGFTHVYRSYPQGSRHEEMRDKGGLLAIGDILEISRMIGFDTAHPEYSLVVEAVK